MIADNDADDLDVRKALAERHLDRRRRRPGREVGDRVPLHRRLRPRRPRPPGRRPGRPQEVRRGRSRSTRPRSSSRPRSPTTSRSSWRRPSSASASATRPRPRSTTSSRPTPSTPRPRPFATRSRRRNEAPGQRPPMVHEAIQSETASEQTRRRPEEPAYPGSALRVRQYLERPRAEWRWSGGDGPGCPHERSLDRLCAARTTPQYDSCKRLGACPATRRRGEWRPSPPNWG